ncbi:MAG TPA: hypothetical protein VI636_12290 [Candidatus Angelobacter sp.]
MFKPMSLGSSVVILALVLPIAAQRAPRSAGAPPSTPTASTPPSTPSSNPTTPGANNNSTQTTNTTGTGSRRQEPCWKVAGVSPAALQQRRGIEQNVRSQVATVCADSSLTAQQRHAKIHEIHAQAQQQMQGLITPEQQEALKSCRASRGEGKETAHPAAGSGPCGEMPTKTPATPNNPGSN